MTLLKILKISLYQPTALNDHPEIGERIELFSRSIDIGEDFASAISRQTGKLLITISARPLLRDAIRATASAVKTELNIIELPFQPR
jgi:hypothetical protein